MIIAIKGFIGSGKSTLANILSTKYNYQVINADLEIKKLYKENKELSQKISDKFKIQYLDGSLDLKKLAILVFSDEIKLEQLEDLVHPFLKDVIEKKINKYKEENKNIILDCQVIDKLLIEYDYEIITFARKEVLIKRIMQRDGRSKEEIEKILKIQDKFYFQKKKAYVINMEKLEYQIEKDFEKIEGIINVEKNWENSQY